MNTKTNKKLNKAALFDIEIEDRLSREDQAFLWRERHFGGFLRRTEAGIAPYQRLPPPDRIFGHYVGYSGTYFK
jgi:hypothetical protein